MTPVRLRFAFAALAIALAIPGGLLVRRALASVAAEREARERAVAERAFDELERRLTELLRGEEARPASDYDFASAASPLRERPPDALALGWFQIEADGHVTAPPWAPDVAALGEEIAAEGARFERVAGNERSRPSADTRDRLLGRMSPPPKPEAAREAPPREPAAATTALDEAVDQRAMRAEAPPPEPERTPPPGAAPVPDESSGPADAYDALAKLNTGAKEREQRKQRVYVQEQGLAAAAAPPEPAAARAPTASSMAASAEADANRAEVLADEARARSEHLVAQALSAPSANSEWGEAPLEDSADAGVVAAGGAGARAENGGAAPPSAVAPSEPAGIAPAAGKIGAPSEAKADAAPPQDAPRAAKRSAASAGAAAPLGRRAQSAASAAAPDGELVRVVVDPLRGRLARSGELVLVRSAWIGARGVRQGVAFEVEALERALGEAALADGALPGAALRVAPVAQRGAAPAARGAVAFAHRFAEPFDALGAELSFARFADDDADTVHWLAALFALAGAGGLFAVYRMTAVALHFAERRSNFAAAVSHELKTPLTAIRLYAEMLRDGLVASDAKRAEYYGSITGEAERLSRLIDNVLEFSRLEKGARQVALSVGDAAPVVREAVEWLRPHAAQHGLALAVAVDDALPPVRFERDALRQIVFNLVDNAIKYGRGEPATIEIACRRADDGVALVVRDHGPGVPREELARILEPFYRRGDELTRSAPGAGIGLALVKSLAERMGAALRVANATNGGLEVSLTLRA